VFGNTTELTQSGPIARSTRSGRRLLPPIQPVELWRYHVAGEVRSAPAVVGGVLSVGGGDGGVYVLDAATGAERWRFQAASPVSSSPAVAKGLVYVGSDDGALYALDALSGDERWRFVLEGGVGYGPVVTSGVAYLSTIFGIVYAIGGSAAPAATPGAIPTAAAGALTARAEWRRR